MTIKYDLPIVDLIDELAATGHVTHENFKKTSVTLHHNGGRLSHRGVLEVWKTRPASAQFDVDGQGRVAQYTGVREYAWSCGNTEGNKRSIHIEMANKTLAPKWEIAPVTLLGAARLAGWLFAHKIEDTPKPSHKNFFVHHHWLSTTCAGPFVDENFDKILKAAILSWEEFMTKKVVAPLEPVAILSPIEQIQLAVGMKGKAVDGVWGPETDHEVLTFRKAHLRR